MQTNEELVELAKAGNTNARELLVHKNMGLVHQIARRYEAAGYTYGDMIGEGVVGLLETVERYDATRGAKFSTAAGIAIEGRMLKAVEGRTSTTNQQRKAFWRLTKVRRAAFDAGVEVTAEALADLAGVSLASAEAVIAAYSPRTSLDTRLTRGASDDDGWFSLHETIADPADSAEEVVIREEEETRRAAALGIALAALAPRLREIVVRGYLTETPENRVEIGATMGISRERVRQLEGKALDFVRESVTATLEGREQPEPPAVRQNGRPRKERPIAARRERVSKALERRVRA